MAAIESEIFCFSDGTCLPISMSIRTHVDEIFQSTAELSFFQFLKADVRHVGILRPVLIWTYSSSYSASAYQISSKSVNAQRFQSFALKLPIHIVIYAAHAQNHGQMYLRDGNCPHIWIGGGRFAYRIQHQLSKRSFSNKGVIREVLHVKALL